MGCIKPIDLYRLDRRDVGFDEASDAFHAVVIGEEGSVGHGAIEDDSAHAVGNEDFGRLRRGCGS